MSGSKLELRVILNAVDKLTRPFKSMQSANTKLAQNIKASREQLKQLNSQASQIDGFRKTQAQAAVTAQNLKKAKAEAAALAQQFRASQNPTAQQTKAMRAAAQNAKQLQQQYNNLQSSLQRQRDALNAAGLSTRTLGTSQRALRTNINSTTQQLRAQQAELTRLGERQRRLAAVRDRYQRSMQHKAVVAGMGYTTQATGRRVGQLGIQSLRVGYEFDALMSKTQAVTRIQDKSAPEMQALRQQARTLPLSSKFTDSEVAEGQYFLARTGYNAKQVLGAMPGMLNLASAGGIDLGTTADIASNIQMAMGIPAEKMDHVADVMTALFTRNNVDIPMLGESLKYSAGVGREYGQSLETVAAATAMLGSAGIQGSQAGTTMRSVLSRIGNSAAVKELGVKTSDKDGNMRDLVDILKDIDAKTAKMGNVDRGAVYKSIAGQYAVTGFGVLMRAASNGSLEKMRGQPGEYDGEAARVAKTMMDNLAGDMTILHAGLENISVELFEKNNGWLRETATKLSGILHSISDFLKAHPAVSKGIVIVAASFAVVASVMGTLMIGVMGILGPLAMLKMTFSVLGIKGFSAFSLVTKGVGLLGKGIVFLGRAMMANPILAIIALIAMAAIWIWQNWDWLGPKFIALWEKVKNACAVAWAYIKNSVITAAKAVLNFFIDWSLPGLIYKHWDAIRDKTGQAWSAFKRVCTDVGTAVANFFINWSLPGIIYKHWDGIVDYVKGLKDSFVDNGRAIIDWLLSGINEKWSELKNKFSSLSDLIPGGVKEFFGIQANAEVQTTSTDQPLSKVSDLASYQPLKFGGSKQYVDQSKTEINITNGSGDADSTAKLKRMLDERDREKAARQRRVLADTN